MGDYLIYLMLALYALAVIGYAWDGNWPKVLYFVGAIILSLGVLWS